MKNRKLKISKMFREPKEQYRLFRATQAVPRIMLAGKWLNDAGFHIGQHVNVEITDLQIIISRLK